MAYMKKELRLDQGGISPYTPQHWSYTGKDAVATVAAAGYLVNAKDVGMRVGDLVFVYVYPTGTENLVTGYLEARAGIPTASICRVTAISAAGAATLSAGTAIA